jgi:hypothetical protein
MELTFLDIFQILTDLGQSSPTTVRYRNIVRLVEVNYSGPVINPCHGKELIFLTACEKTFRLMSSYPTKAVIVTICQARCILTKLEVNTNQYITFAHFCSRVIYAEYDNLRLKRKYKCVRGSLYTVMGIATLTVLWKIPSLSYSVAICILIESILHHISK